MLDYPLFVQGFTQWLLESGLRILGVVVGVLILKKVVDVFLERSIRKLIKSSKFQTKDAERKREDTLIRIASTTFDILILLVGGLIILSELGLDITPLLAGAGIVGVAVGFGGQYLIRDLIAGTFIILENQYRVGDVVCIGGKCGLVEDISLRTTILRDLDGTVHFVPNGEVKVASNLTKEYARVNLDIGISYDADLEKVEKVVNKLGEEMARDKAWKDKILKPPAFVRVDEFADSAVIIKILGETVALTQWEVMGEFRKRLKIAFDKNGIEIPFPQRVVHQPQNK